MVARIEGQNVLDEGFNAFNVRNEKGQYDKKQAATLVKNIKAALDPQQKGINDSLKDIAKKLGENTVAVSQAFQSATEKDKEQFTTVMQAAKAIGKKTGPAAQGAAGRTFRDEAIKLENSNSDLYKSLGIEDAAFKDSGIFKLKSDFKNLKSDFKNNEGMFSGEGNKLGNFTGNALKKFKTGYGFGDTGFLGLGSTAETKKRNAKLRVADAQISNQSLDGVKGLEQAIDTVAGTELSKEKKEKTKSIGEKSAEKSKDKAAEKASSNSGLDTESTAQKQFEVLEDIHGELKKLNELVEGGAMAGSGDGGGGMMDMLDIGTRGRRGRPGRSGRPGRMGRMFQGVRNFAGRGLSAARGLGARGLALGTAALAAGPSILSSGVDLAKAGANKVASIGSSVIDSAKGLFTKGTAEAVEAAGETTARSAARTATREVAETAGKKGLVKTAGKGLGKSLLKKIPGVGLVAGLGFGAQRLMSGDWKGALGEVASGAASTIPGLGTAASVAIDAGLAARDMGVFSGPDVPDASRPVTPDAPGAPKKGLFSGKLGKVAKFGTLGLAAGGALAGGKMLYNKFFGDKKETRSEAAERRIAEFEGKVDSGPGLFGRIASSIPGLGTAASIGEKISSGKERLSNWWEKEKFARGIDSSRDMRGEIELNQQQDVLFNQQYDASEALRTGTISQDEYNSKMAEINARKQELYKAQEAAGGSGLTQVSATTEIDDRDTQITSSDGSTSSTSNKTMDHNIVSNRIIDLPFINEQTDFGSRLAANAASMLSDKGGHLGTFVSSGIEENYVDEEGVTKTRDSILGKRTASGSFFKADDYEINVEGEDENGNLKIERYKVPKAHYMAIQELVKDNKLDEAQAYIEKRIKPNFENLDAELQDELNKVVVPEGTTSEDPLVGMYGPEVAAMMNDGLGVSDPSKALGYNTAELVERTPLPTADAVSNMTEAAVPSSATAAPVINNITNNNTNPTSKPILLNPKTARSTGSSLSRFQDSRYAGNGF